MRMESGRGLCPIRLAEQSLGDASDPHAVTAAGDVCREDAPLIIHREGRCAVVCGLKDVSEGFRGPVGSRFARLEAAIHPQPEIPERLRTIDSEALGEQHGPYPPSRVPEAPRWQ